MHSVSFSLKNSGFSALETVILIATLLVSLAVIWRQVDPLEQIRKAGDTALIEVSQQLYKASLQYYSESGKLLEDEVHETLAGSSATQFLQLLVINKALEGHILQDWESRRVMSKITLHGSEKDISFCFLPQSSWLKTQSASRYNDQGVKVESCDATSCYWCSSGEKRVVVPATK